MTTFNELDFGPSHAWLKPTVGQVLGTSHIEGDTAIAWARGAVLEEQQLDLYVQPWQALGGAAAGTRQALLYLLRQLEELVSRAEPILIRWTTTAAPGAFTADDVHDGWYIVSQAAPPYRRYVVTGGVVTAPLTAVRVAPASAPLSLRWTGGAFSSTYTTQPVPLLSYPIGATQQIPAQMSRVGGEGTIPLSALALGSAINPAWFTRPGTVSALWTGGVKVFDTLVPGGNAVPAAGAGFVNSNWVQIYAGRRNFQGDCIITNGLLLLRLNVGGTNVPNLYVWNTQGSPIGWQQVTVSFYKDLGFNVGTIAALNVWMVGYQRAEAIVVVGTSAGNYVRLLLALEAGLDGFEVLTDFRTQSNTFSLAYEIVFQTAVKIVANEAAVVDVGLNPGTNLAPSTGAGWAVGIGTTANQPLGGLAWQNPPNAGQPAASSTTEMGFGETTGPALNTPRRYFVWAVPFVGAQNLQAEAETGTLGTGWTSVTDGSVQAAKCASGTLTGNADLFGATWVPPPGAYDLWMQMRVASPANGVNAWDAGLWDRTSPGFVGTATHLAPSGIGTSYIWLRVATDVTPTATHNMGYRIVTTATTVTDLFVNQAVLVPKRGTTPGQSDFPEDIWRQLMFGRTTRLVRG